jgi:hypothetical protein
MKKFYFYVLISLSVALNAFSQLPVDGLIGYWPFNGNANDVVGNNHGIVHGATLCANRFGYPDKAYYFDGSNDNISLLFENSIDINTKSSILLWFKAEKNLNAYAKLISVPISLETWTNPYHYLAFSGQAFNYANFDPVNGFCETGYFTAQGDTNWNLLAFTYNEGDIKVYINGILKETLSCSSTLMPIGSTMSIGSRSTSILNNGEYFTGKIDDLSIYDSVLTQSEILNYYNYLCHPKTRDVIFSYQVSDLDFKKINNSRYLDSTKIITGSNDCDSLIYFYSEFTYNEITDTVTIFDTISVLDTLIIDVEITNLGSVQNTHQIKVYPNPSNDVIFIHLGENYQQLSDYRISIINATGKSVFESQLTESEFEINVNDFGHYGLFLLRILDKTGRIVDNKKLIVK